MQKIKINCEGCGLTHEVNRDKEAPKDSISMSCNWCPACEDKAEDYYEEWYNKGGDDGDNSDGGDPNQLMMFSIADSVLAENEKKHEPIILNDH